MTATGKSVSPDGISTLLSIPKPESPTDFPEIILKVTNLEPKGKSYGYLYFFMYLLSFRLLVFLFQHMFDISTFLFFMVFAGLMLVMER